MSQVRSNQEDGAEKRHDYVERLAGSKLDLKFIIHHGEYVLQTISGPGKPLGSEVNLAHRLLKNHVGESTGWKAYALLTQPAARALGIGTTGMHEQVETYPELPPVSTFSFDLRARWQELRRRQQVRLTEVESDLQVSINVGAAPPPAPSF